MSQREHAYNKIRAFIINAELRPGERLIEKNLCKMFNVGRTPLREALIQLQMEGYLHLVPNQGLIVNKMSAEDLKDIYDTLAVLEGYATEIATKHINILNENKLDAIQNRLKKAYRMNNHKEWIRTNRMFHEYITKASNNNSLYSVIKSLRNRIYRYTVIAGTISASLEKYYAGHEEILKAISEKNAKKAGNAMRRHVVYAEKELVKVLQQIPGV